MASRTCRGESARRGRDRDARGDAALEAGHADHEELVEVRGEDRQEPHPLEQREVGVLGQLEHPLVERQPGQLAVQEPVVGQRLELELGVVDARAPSAGRTCSAMWAARSGSRAVSVRHAPIVTPWVNSWYRNRTSRRRRPGRSPRARRCAPRPCSRRRCTGSPRSGPRRARWSRPERRQRAPEAEALGVRVDADDVDLADAVRRRARPPGAPWSTPSRAAGRRARRAGTPPGRTSPRPRAPAGPPTSSGPARGGARTRAS